MEKSEKNEIVCDSCAICHDNKDEQVLYDYCKCVHSSKVCKDCWITILSKWDGLEDELPPKCPICRAQQNEEVVFKWGIENQFIQEYECCFISIIGADLGNTEMEELFYPPIDIEPKRYCVPICICFLKDISKMLHLLLKRLNIPNHYLSITRAQKYNSIYNAEQIKTCMNNFSRD